MILNNIICKQIIREYINQLKFGRNDDIRSTIVVKEEYVSDRLGELICALSNYGALIGIPYMYALWGIDEVNKTVCGTSYSPLPFDELESIISIRATYSIMKISYDNFPVVVLEVQSALNTSMQFEGVEYILDEDLKICELKDYPEKSKTLWRKLNNNKSFVTSAAKTNVSISEIIDMLDCQTFFKMLSIDYPNNPAEIITKLIEFHFVVENNIGRYTITNLGALLLAKRLRMFPSVEYKAVRVLQYSGSDVTYPAKEQIGGKGYIIGFSGLIDYIIKQLPTIEQIEGAIRQEMCIYPPITIRELVANALIHQDLEENGAPVISIFTDRIEITNPGAPLIHFDRFIDHPPISRNEALVAAMRKVGICEERGSGYDKIIESVENLNLSVPMITEYEKSTKVCLYSKRGFDNLSKREKNMACYAHVCLNYIRNKPSNNSTLRARFKLTEKERYKVSRVFSDACKEKLIKKHEGTAMKNSEYLPYWAPKE